MTITTKDKANGFTQYDNSRYIETVNESELKVINDYIDSKSNVYSFEGNEGLFSVEIGIHLISRKKTQTIAGEYNGIYFEQNTKL